MNNLYIISMKNKVNKLKKELGLNFKTNKQLVKHNDIVQT